MPRTHYEVLGVALNASTEEIHRAYRRLARQHHPDLNADTDARARFEELSRAYEVLHDPERRAAYDRLSAAAAGDRVERRRAPGFVPRFIDDLPERGLQPPIRLVVRIPLRFRWPPW